MAKGQKASKRNTKEASQWILLAPDGVMNVDNVGNPTFIQLKHPRTSEGVQFLLSQNEKSICEVMKFQEEPRSWFLEDTVQEDGSFLIATPVDPLFLIMPYLIKCSQKFRTVDQILMDKVYPAIQRLISCVSAEEMLNVCDVKGDEDLQAYRLNNDRVLAWLRQKVECTADRLALQRIHVSSGSQCATFVRSRKHSEVSRDDYIQYGYGLVSDYISSDLSAKLKDDLGITEETKVVENEPPAKKARLSTEIPEAVEDYSKEFNMSTHKEEKSATKLTAAQRSLAKVDKKGMKSIASFFGGGTKKKTNKT